MSHLNVAVEELKELVSLSPAQGGTGIPNLKRESLEQSNASLDITATLVNSIVTGADLGGGCRGCAPPPPPEMTCGFLIQLVFSKKKNYVVYSC